MIRPVLDGNASCVPILHEWMEPGDDCALWVDYSPTDCLGAVFQMAGPKLQKSAVKESKELAGRLTAALRGALGGTGRIRPPSIKDMGVRDRLDTPMPACLVYLPPDLTRYLERPEGALLAACAIYQGLESWSLWLRGMSLHNRSQVNGRSSAHA